MTIDDLSISDGKNAMDFLEDRKKERMHFLKLNNLDIYNDRAYNSLEKLQSEIHTRIFTKIRKLGYGKE